MKEFTEEQRKKIYIKALKKQTRKSKIGISSMYMYDNIYYAVKSIRPEIMRRGSSSITSDLFPELHYFAPEGNPFGWFEDGDNDSRLNVLSFCIALCDKPL